jgi:membrane peptidoglycan carboxypeptidase
LLLLDPQQQAERTLQRKLKEAVLALRLQNTYSKQHILELYLNQAYFGNLAYGIEAAARTYFHRSATELSLGECALLMGVVQNAVMNDPLANFDTARARQQVVLNLMVNNGYLTPQEAAAAFRDELQFGSTPFPIDAPHFVMAVWTQLERNYPDALYTQGLDVITTLDLSWHNAAQTIVRQQLDYLNHPPAGSRIPANANNAALIALDPYTGQVLTMLGSPDYFDESIDGAVNATLAMRQPGSALKPFTYAAAMDPALDDPYTPATVLLDIKTPFVTRRLESYTPANYGLVEHGPVSVRESLASSFNIPAVAALDHVGLDNFGQFLTRIGLEDLAQNNRVDLSITLGGGEVRLLDLATAYAIFPNGGYRIQPQMILKVTRRDGNTLFEYDPPPLSRRVLDERVAFLINDMLSDNNARLAGFGLNSPLQIGRTAAAKTGTTTNFKDNWVVGYTPNLVVGVWVGNADNSSMVEVTGVSGAGPIYNRFMRNVLLGQPDLKFTRPDGLRQIEICALSGLLPTDACQRRKREFFIDGTQPTEYDTMHQIFQIDRRTGQLADPTTPPEYLMAQTFIVLPQEARDWGRRHGVRTPPIGAEIIQTDEDRRLRLLEPDPYTIYERSPIIPLETQRLRLIVGAPPDTQAVTYYLDESPIGTADTEPWALWWTLALGDHELTAVATLSDGTTETSAPIPFRVVDYEPPRPQTLTAGARR